MSNKIIFYSLLLISCGYICSGNAKKAPQNDLIFCDSIHVIENQYIRYCINDNNEYFIALNNGTFLKTDPFLIESHAKSCGIYTGQDTSAYIWLDANHLFLACPIGLDTYYGRVLNYENKELSFGSFKGLNSESRYVFLPKKKLICVLETRRALAGQATYYSFDPHSELLEPVLRKKINSFGEEDDEIVTEISLFDNE